MRLIVKSANWCVLPYYFSVLSYLWILVCSKTGLLFTALYSFHFIFSANEFSCSVWCLMSPSTSVATYSKIHHRIKACINHRSYLWHLPKNSLKKNTNTVFGTMDQKFKKATSGFSAHSSMSLCCSNTSSLTRFCTVVKVVTTTNKVYDENTFVLKLTWEFHKFWTQCWTDWQLQSLSPFRGGLCSLFVYCVLTLWITVWFIIIKKPCEILFSTTQKEYINRYTLTLTYTYNTMPEWSRGNDAALPAGFFCGYQKYSIISWASRESVYFTRLRLTSQSRPHILRSPPPRTHSLPLSNTPSS